MRQQVNTTNCWINMRDLRLAVQALHSCRALHERSVKVQRQSASETTWTGNVEVFTLFGHPTADRAYAWSTQDEKGQIQNTVYLHSAAIPSAKAAVLAALSSVSPEAAACQSSPS